MVAIQSHYNSFIHFDLTQQKDHEDKQQVQCSEWKGGFYSLMEHHSSSFKSQAGMVMDSLIGNQTIHFLIR